MEVTHFIWEILALKILIAIILALIIYFLIKAFKRYTRN